MHLFQRIVNIGINPEEDPIHVNRVTLINFTALYPLLLYLFSTIYCIVFNYPRIVYINIFAFLATALVLYLNYKGRFSLGKSLLIVTHAAVVFLYYKLMMDEPGVFGYFIPIILMFGLFFSPKEERRYLIVTAILVALFFFGSFIIPNRLFAPALLSPSLHRFIFIFCSTTSVILTAVYVANYLKISARNESVLKKAKEEAEEGLRTKARFLSTMSHELRTPLNGIIGTADIIQQEEHTASQQPHLDVLKNLSDHMLALVNDILDYSKIESGKVELHHHRFNILELFRKTEIIFRGQFKDKGIVFKTDPDPRLAEMDVYFDELRLQQVLNNLIANALKFTERGEVTVTASIISQSADNLKLFFSVADTGIGIVPGKQKQIFSSFSQGDSATTRKYGGTGLGLSISDNLVKMMKGTLAVKSEPGAGSNFFFVIDMPVYKEQDAGVVETRLLSIERLKNLKVLIAEDNPVNMMVARRVLRKWDLQLTEVENGKQALEKCSAEDFDVLLIDLEMPEMDGRMAVKEINKLRKGIPCIAFTAAVYENMKQDLQQHGFTDYLLKPFKPEDLYSKIVAALQQKLYYN